MIDIIPAIDIIDGRCVRLTQGDFDRKTVYAKDSLDIAVGFEDAGIRRLHIVDLDGARTGEISNLRVLERIANSTGLIIDFGGGIKSRSDVKSVISAGASMAVVGSAAVTRREEFLEWVGEFGAERFLLGADVRDGMISVDGWRTDTSLGVVPFLKELRKSGIGRAFVTDISSDGLLEGPALPLYEKILGELPGFGLIASGGVGTVEDVLALAACGANGVIIGKAIYEGRIDVGELVEVSQSA